MKKGMEINWTRLFLVVNVIFWLGVLCLGGAGSWQAYAVNLQLAILLTAISWLLALYLGGVLNKQLKVAAFVGSDSDFKQCKRGFDFIRFFNPKHDTPEKQEKHVKVLGVYTCSIHRNMFTVLFNLFILWVRQVDVIIVGAGWAAHLPGMCEAFCRYVLRNTSIRIIPVAFDAAPDKPDVELTEDDVRKNRAAVYSISEVPKHQMLLLPKQPKADPFCFGAAEGVSFGEPGFYEAWVMACSPETFPIIKLPSRVPARKRTLAQAIAFAEKSRKEVVKK